MVLRLFVYLFILGIQQLSQQSPAKRIKKDHIKLDVIFLREVYGKRGNWSKSGLRFSLNASRPSFASSVV